MPPPELVIRRAHPDNAQAMTDYVIAITNEPHNNVVRDPGQWTMTVEEERAFVGKLCADPDQLFLLAFLGETLVGEASIRRSTLPTERHAASIGVSVGATYRRRGIGRALVESLLAWAREQKLRRIELQVFARNPGAISLYEQLGFVKEGLHRMAFFKQGQWVDEYTMALILEEAPA